MSCVLVTDQQPPVLKCTICGGTGPFSLPMTVDQMSAIVKAFEGKHKLCAFRKSLKEHPQWAHEEDNRL